MFDQKICMLFRHQIIRIVSILAALFMKSSKILFATTSVFAGGETPAVSSLSPSKGEWTSKKWGEWTFLKRLNKLAYALKILSGKAAEILLAIVKSVVDAILSFLGKAAWFVHVDFDCFYCRAHWDIVDAESKTVTHPFFITFRAHENNMFYILFKAKNSSPFIASRLKCLSWSGPTTINPCSCQTLWLCNLENLPLKGKCPDNGAIAVCSCAFYSTAILSSYRYIGILCCLIALCSDGYTIIFIVICKKVRNVSLQGSYFMVFCSCHSLKTYILILNDLYLISLQFGPWNWIFSIFVLKPSGKTSLRISCSRVLHLFLQ